ncbi:MAG: hypothetical protein AAF620_00230 [Bacteroidota bacterium]
MAQRTIIELQNQDVLLDDDEFPFWRTLTGVTSKISFGEFKTSLGIGDLSLPSQDLTISNESTSLNFTTTRIFELNVHASTQLSAIDTEGDFFEDNQLYYIKIVPSQEVTISFDPANFSIPPVITSSSLTIAVIAVSKTLAIAFADPALSSAIMALKDGVPSEGDTLNKLYNLIQGVVSVDATATDIADRDAQAGFLNDQQNIYVADASADASVSSGWAIYKYLASDTNFIKIAEQESLDVNAALTSAITVNIGGDNVGGAQHGQTFPAGTTFQQLAEALLVRVVQPFYRAPDLYINSVDQKVGEIGAQHLSKLYVYYYQRDAGAASEFRLYKDDVVLTSKDAIPDSEFTDTLIFIDGIITYHCEIDHAEGPIKTDNFGNPHPLGQIPGGTLVSGNNVEYLGVYPWFFGVSPDGVIGNVDVYKGAKMVAEVSNSIDREFYYDGFPWFAIPSYYPTFTKWKNYYDENETGLIGGEGSLFAAPIKVSVSSRELAVNWTQEYNLYMANSSISPSWVVLTYDD